jgi:hypothetical protein
MRFAHPAKRHQSLYTRGTILNRWRMWHYRHAEASLRPRPYRKVNQP